MRSRRRAASIALPMRDAPKEAPNGAKSCGSRRSNGPIEFLDHFTADPLARRAFDFLDHDPAAKENARNGKRGVQFVHNMHKPPVVFEDVNRPDHTSNRYASRQPVMSADQPPRVVKAASRQAAIGATPAGAIAPGQPARGSKGHRRRQTAGFGTRLGRAPSARRMIAVASHMVRPWTPRRVVVALDDRRPGAFRPQLPQAATDRVKVVGCVRSGHPAAPRCAPARFIDGALCRLRAKRLCSLLSLRKTTYSPQRRAVRAR